VTRVTHLTNVTPMSCQNVTQCDTLTPKNLQMQKSVNMLIKERFINFTPNRTWSPNYSVLVF
jgi:hypothetical protein